MKKLFARLKNLFDAYKMWLFFTAILFGTNGAQMYVHSEPEKAGLPIEKVKPVAIKPVRTKTIIIYKLDKEYCKKLIETEFNKHYDSSRH